ncbi:hypothetical protein DSO57_1020946 [Entomophthora muscae]|uniref:Uncharacterized protein n=1 Tax=Entomophthora muscae TaxID=34485 RepID=A0ACC2SSI7_9FUNG|nr:hypothetical protein DSO57_1020946 [Entomophthora muscae]
MVIDYERVNQVLKYVYANAIEGDAESVLKTIDTFCYEHQWCMNVGDVKGPIVRDVIAEHKPKVIVELGGYYGYSAIMFANFLKNDPDAIYYTIEINPILACVIEKTTRFAGLGDKVRVLTGNLSQNLEVLKNKYGISQVDMLFLDHIKDAYLPDFLLAEERCLFHKNTVIVADNVITPGAPDYLAHLMDHPRFSSKLIKTELEYSFGMEEDGILVSVPVQKPIAV